MKKILISSNLNNSINPYNSNSIPTNGHPINTIVMPPKNDIDAFALCF